MILKEVPEDERPREKALMAGLESLSNVELLAIILRTGSKSENAIQLAQSILYQFPSLLSFRETTVEELIKIKGVKVAKALSILACMEFGRRLEVASETIFYPTSPLDIFNYMKNRVMGLKQECLFGLYLDSHGKLCSCHKLSQGTINSTLIDSKEIFKWAYKYSCQQIILVHNHPSGNSNPSRQDILMTQSIVETAKLLSLIILDHIIIGNDYYSFKLNYLLTKE